MDKKLIDWLLFALLSIIWGSSFILMKIGLDFGLTAYQVAAIRIVASGIVLLPTCLKVIRSIPIKKMPVLFLSGTLGSLVPAFLFCVAEQEIDSSLTGMINCLTPIFVIIMGAIFFKIPVASNKMVGIVISFIGSVLLLLSKGHIGESRHLLYVSLVILATMLYGFNVNMVSKNLLQIPSLHIAAVGLTLNAIPALAILIFTGYFSLPLLSQPILIATSAAAFLGIGGTAIATVIFYMLVKRVSGIFASMVTYGIPFVAIGWGILYKENFGWLQVGCLLIILSGVFWANKKPALTAAVSG